MACNLGMYLVDMATKESRKFEGLNFLSLFFSVHFLFNFCLILA